MLFLLGVGDDIPCATLCFWVSLTIHLPDWVSEWVCASYSLMHVVSPSAQLGSSLLPAVYTGVWLCWSAWSLLESLACIACSSPCILSSPSSYKDRNARGWARQMAWSPDNGCARGDTSLEESMALSTADQTDRKICPVLTCHPTLSPLFHLSDSFMLASLADNFLLHFVSFSFSPVLGF